MYLDANIIVYIVERHATYWPLLQPLWDAYDTGRIRLITSELSLLEVLVKPERDGNPALAGAYEQFLA